MALASGPASLLFASNTTSSFMMNQFMRKSIFAFTCAGKRTECWIVKYVVLLQLERYR